MQDDGIFVEDFESQSKMETLALSPSEKDDDAPDGVLNFSQALRPKSVDESNGGRLDEKEILSVSPRREAAPPKVQNLPENISSDFKNVSPKPNEKEDEIATLDVSESAKKIHKQFPESDEENVRNLTEIVPVENCSVTVEAKSAVQEDRRVPEISESNRRDNLVPSLKEKDSRKIDSEVFRESGVTDSRGSKHGCEINENEGAAISEVSKQRKNCTAKPPMLSDDSKLVKISLPTSSMNIMQTNTQFLNKSRNFLNFITEKSTNIMEKTLLPQNLAARYNSILRMTDVTPIEKKNHQDSSMNHESSTTNLASDSQSQQSAEPCKISENPRNDETNEEKEIVTESKITETDQREKAHSDTELSDNVSTKQNGNLASTNECSDSSDKILEMNDSESKNLQHEATEGIEKSSIEDSIQIESCIASIESNRGLLEHPVYLTLVRDYARMREDKFKLAERVENLEAKNRILEAQNSNELFNVQLEALGKTVERLSAELRAANTNQEELRREYAVANKERESAVMKYAIREKQLIDTQRARDCAERRYKEISKDYELLQVKLRQGQSEKTRICNILDGKCRELTDSQKEVERLKEEVNLREVKLKWTQTKLKTEMENNKETQAKLDKATARINDMRDECEQIRRGSQEMMRQFQHSEENKAVTLDQQLKEQQARLILERHVTEDKENLRLQLQKEVEQLKNRQLALIEENNTLSLKIQDLEKNRLSYESKLSDLKNVADQRQKEIVDLTAKVSHLETLKLQLIHKEQCLMSNEAEVERLRQVNQELQTDMDCCRQREAHMLDFTQKLTDKNVRLQSEFTAIEAKSAQLEQEQGPLRASIAEFKTRVKKLEENLAHEKNKRIEECEILARHLAEQTQIAKNLTQKLEESQGEIAVLRRKQQISVKEMSRELQQCRKRLELYENASPSNSLDPTSRAGSSNSLNAGETLNGATSDNSGNGEPTRQSAELDRQSLIDRILKMQKINVRRAEKLDFLEEHTRTLVAELQKKTKIIQNYILHENFDAMGSNERDRHKAELARYGGIMASVYSHRVSDDNMTLELSLEINQKLQAVLEDALLKNITLKDNIDTLGEEIARLTIKNQQMLQQIQK